MPKIQLSDGRALGFETLGDPDGLPLFFFHGTPGSRLVVAEDDLMVRMLPGVRLILPERPGYGISDPAPSRTLLDWPGDVAQLADHLGLDTFAVSGISGGGPYALACAHRLAGRVTQTLLFSSPSPAGFKGATKGMAFGNRLVLFLSRYAPVLMRWLLRSSASAIAKDPQSLLDVIEKQVSPPDQALLEDASVREAILRDIREAYRQGGDGHVVDGPLAMTSKDWGFNLREISVPVFLWHGAEDTLVTIHMAKYLEHEIPDCTARIVPGAGHMLADMPAVVEEVRKVLFDEAA